MKAKANKQPIKNAIQAKVFLFMSKLIPPRSMAIPKKTI